MRRYRLMSFGAVFLIAAGYVFLVSLNNDIIPLDTTGPTSPLIIGNENIYLDLELDLPKSSEQTAAKMIIRNITFLLPKNEQSTVPLELCIDDVIIGDMWNYGEIRQAYHSAKSLGSLCSNSRDKVTRINGLEEVIIGMENQSLEFGYANSFWYPYDNIRRQLAIQVIYHLTQKGETIRQGVVVPTASIKSLGFENWNMEVHQSFNTWSTEDVKHGIAMAADPLYLSAPQYFRELKLGTYSLLQITVSRPLLFRLAPPLILILIVILIALLTLVDDLGAFLQASAGILFSIYGIRQILIPSSLAGIRTLLDTAIIGIYFTFTAALLLYLVPRILRGVKVNKLSNNQTQTTNKADSPLNKDYDNFTETQAQITTQHPNTTYNKSMWQGLGILTLILTITTILRWFALKINTNPGVCQRKK